MQLTPHAHMCNMIEETLRIGSDISTAIITKIESQADYALLSSEQTLEWMRGYVTSKYGPTLLKAEDDKIVSLHGAIVTELFAQGDVLDFAVVGMHTIVSLAAEPIEQELAS